MQAKVKQAKDAVIEKKRGQGVLASTLSFGGGALHATHRLHHKRGIIWCWNCGAYGTEVVRRLAEICDGDKGRGGEENLRRVKQGKTPRYDLDWPLLEGEGPGEGRVLMG